ncbi:MAG: hypothetical protein Q8936_01505 [Bacillota bacterium]|nr:hypothetical protein [Bacillota bacterium]
MDIQMNKADKETKNSRNKNKEYQGNLTSHENGMKVYDAVRKFEFNLIKK